MNKFKYFQPNKKDAKNKRGDCVIKALCAITGEEWLSVYDELMMYGREEQALPDEKIVWIKFLEKRGYKWVNLPAQKGKSRPTVKTVGKYLLPSKYILRVSHHLVSVVDGEYLDSWDSGECSVYGYYAQF